jgi:hypothetical protein
MAQLVNEGHGRSTPRGKRPGCGSGSSFKSRECVGRGGAARWSISTAASIVGRGIASQRLEHGIVDLGDPG